MNENKESSSNRTARITRSGWVMIFVSSLIIGAAIIVAVLRKLPVLEGEPDQWLPFLFALIGVMLYVMTIMRRRRESFQHAYTPVFFFRGAQAVVYLYLILAIITQTRSYESRFEFEDWPASLIGLLVGLFIQHVEKAVEGLGQRFEEALAAILPRALTAKTSREKQADQLRAEARYHEIVGQAEGLAAQIRDPALVRNLRKKIEETKSVIRSEDESEMQDRVADLAWFFEEVKTSVREEEMTIEEVLGRVSHEKGASHETDADSNPTR